MRPLRLEVEGFTAFRQPVVVDFEGADLFALVGPTGAGKTSVVDAVTFALYGTVPRLDDRRAVAPVVSQNLVEARVRLDFAVGAERYTAVRVVKATRSGATTKEARLERGADPASRQVIAGTADEVGAAVVDLLGLTYEHFITCVSLPQGQFARFLHDKPRDRQDLLVRLLDLGLYDKVASAARQQAMLAASRAEVLTGQLERLAGATAAAHDEARARVKRLATLADQLAEIRPELDRLADAARQANDRAVRQTAQVELLERLRPPDGVAELCAALARAAAVRAEWAQSEEEASAQVTAAEQRLAALPSRSELERVRNDLTRRDELERHVATGHEALRAAAERIEQAVHTEAEAEQAREAAGQRLRELQVTERAHALVPELKTGEPCPVCRQRVEAIPDIHLPDLVAAEHEVATAARHLKTASRALSDARTEQLRIDDKIQRLTDELHDVVGRLEDQGDRQQIEAQLAAVVEADAELDRARAADQKARAARREAERRYEQLLVREAEARRAFEAARDAVAALQPPPAERRDLAADWDALLQWADERRPALQAELDSQRSEAARLEEQAAGRLREVIAACRDAGVDAVQADEWPGEAVAAARARADETVQRLEADLAEADRLREEVGAATEQRQVAEVLAGHLAANRFEKWLLDEAVQRLVAGASTILGELSGDAYSLSVDERSGAFTVIDHVNASQPRPARTLSGGETFLASLALALALADQVSELAVGGVARLEALFLDEGFGTLDPDALDVVAAALDELGARGRMVGVVTHVRDLADRLPVRFEVRKVAGTATIERVEA